MKIIHLESIPGGSCNMATKKPNKAKELDKMSPAQQAAEMTQENMVLNIRNNFYDANRVIWLVGSIDEETQYDVIKWLHFYNDKTKKPVTIYINSFGGSVHTMFAIVDLINELKSNGVVVNTVCLGTAQSAGAVILSSGSKGHRYMTPYSTAMIHSIQYSCGDIQSKTKDVTLNAKWIERLQSITEKILVENTGKSIKEIHKNTEYETYFTAEEAVKFGLADKVDTLIV